MIREVKKQKKIEHYDNVRIRIASPEAVRDWSYGEVTKPDTLNYRTFKPEKDGLFCERIFGPEKDFECSCGKYKKKRFQDTVCDRCGVEVASSRVRRSRMGHIELAAPVAHFWFVKSTPSKIGTLLDLTIKKLERVLYYESYIVIKPGHTDYEKKELIDIEEYLDIKDKVDDEFKAMMGAEAIKILLDDLELESEAMNLRTVIRMETSAIKKQKMIKKLKVVDAFFKSGNNPSWMILEVLPVLPPVLRPLVPIEGGKFATADFNDLYRRVITRNNRLRQLIEIRAPEVILRNEKRMLQEAVDALIDNAKRSRPVKARGNRVLKSLTDQLTGKQGRFRQNLLGKRVDYSGRSVITVGPHLKINQVGLPKEMAVELFKPFIIEKLERHSEIEKSKSARKLIDKKKPEIWKVLEEIIEDYPVLLNRAPTLHKLGIQAFKPILTENKALEIHPMVCTPFNADFDGDQMAVHVPLSHEAKMEAKVLMMADRNLLLPANGKLAMVASQDIVLGCYYLTMEKTKQPEITSDLTTASSRPKLRYYGNFNEVLLAFESCEVKSINKDEIPRDIKSDRHIDLHTWVVVLYKDEKIVTTVGRVLFNQIIPNEVPYQNYSFDKGKLNDVAMLIYEQTGQHRTSQFLDDLKDLGFKYATKSGVTFSSSDILIPKKKQKIISATEDSVNEIIDSYYNGAITEKEKSSRIIDRWKMATELVTDVLMAELKDDQGGFNSIHMMYLSGARGGKDQIKQLGGMRGLMDKPTRGGSSVAEVIDTPIKSNFKEGLTVLEYFISTHGARKGLADTALKTADAGYLTRRLVDVAQNAIIHIEDCGTIEGLEVSAIKEGLEVVVSLAERIQGRTALEDVVDNVTGKVLTKAGDEITNSVARTIQKHGLSSVKIRSVVTCEAKKGICAKCYGRNLASQKPVTVGEPVGIIAAQSIGEPGTQLTLRTFHIGGAASTDIDEAEVVANYDGVVKFKRMNTVTTRSGELVSISKQGRILLLDENDGNVLDEYKVEYASTIYVNDGDKIVKDFKLFSWDPYNNPLLATSEGTIKYENFIKGTTYKEEFNDITGTRETTIVESKDRNLQPQFKLLKPDGTQEIIPLQSGIIIEIEDDSYVYPGTILGKTSRITIKMRDITGGLPRVADLFEARVPKDKAIISEIAGTVRIGDLTKSGRTIYVIAETGEEIAYSVPSGKRLIVHQGDYIDNGDPLSDGPLDPRDILAAKGIKAAQMLILNEIQEIYRKQGVRIDDKHIGVIIRQMFKRVKIVDPGHTFFLEGDLVDKNEVIEENDRINLEEAIGATYDQIMLGITKASLHTESWLSAASFQETTKVLTQASIEGKNDRLEGLKESIILGHRVPVGTGSKHYTTIVDNALKDGKTVAQVINEIAHTEKEEEIDDILNF